MFYQCFHWSNAVLWQFRRTKFRNTLDVADVADDTVPISHTLSETQTTQTDAKIMTTTYRLFGGDLGSEQMFVRCDLSQASAPVQVNYAEGAGWDSTQYQCADCRHTESGLVRIGKLLAAEAIQVCQDDFACDAEK